MTCLHEQRFPHESLLSRHPVGQIQSLEPNQSVTRCSTEQLRTQTDKYSKWLPLGPSVCPSFCLSLCCLLGFVCGRGSLRLSLSSLFSLSLSFHSSFFQSVGVSVALCQSLLAAAVCCACACDFFFVITFSYCLLLSVSAHVSSLLSFPVLLSVCLFRSVYLSVYPDLLWRIFACVSVCFDCTHTHAHKHACTPARLPPLGSLETCKWDMGGDKQIKLKSRLSPLSSFFYEPPIT